MQSKTYLFFLFLALAVSLSPLPAKAQYSLEPRTNGGEKWRLGYYDSGPSFNYYKSLVGTVEGLMTLGWIRSTKIPKDFEPEDTRGLWMWLSQNIKSDYLVFLLDGFWSQNWDNAARPALKEQIIQRLNDQGDIDLMIVMGTKAGLDLANDLHSIPTVIGSTTDALSAGIIKSMEDSGYDHVHAMVDVELYEMQLKVFHRIVGFERLGVAYRDSEVGRSTSAIETVENMAKILGFKVIPCDLNSMIPGSDESENKEAKIVKCHEFLAPRVDAVYITYYAGGVTLENMPNLMKPLYEHGIPTFSQAGSRFVRHGCLFSISMSRFGKIGMFYAETIAKIFNGARPRDLPQVFKQPPQIAINLAAAQKIGYSPPVDVVYASDEIYQEIFEAK